MSFLWEAFQYDQIRSASARADVAMSESNRVRDKVHEESGRTNARIDQLVLLCQSMWELLCERSNITDEDLKAKVLEIDLTSQFLPNPFQSSCVTIPVPLRQNLRHRQ